MKKALVLGVLAFFAINIASVQSLSAQVNNRSTSNEKTSTEQADKDKIVKPKAESLQQDKQNNKPAQTVTADDPKKANLNVGSSKKAATSAQSKKTTGKEPEQPAIGVKPDNSKKTTTGEKPKNQAND